MRLLLAGGGTGGHLFPAVALAQTLRHHNPQSRVQFVGTERGLESRLLPRLGLPLATIDMVGFVGRGLRGKIQTVPRLIKSVGQSLAIVRSFRPDLVVGVGGYASVPVLLAARMTGIPCVLHEQNAIPGLSNKLLARMAKTVCVSFPASEKYFGRASVVVTGNPLREGMADVSAAVPENGILLIFGGSRGARAINQAVVAMLPELISANKGLRILHQSGDDDLDMVRRGYEEAGLDPDQVVPFIDDMAAAYEQAKLVICRAGATTIAELTACGRPAILIPYPFAAGDHQTANGAAVVNAGAGQLLSQKELTASKLAALTTSLLADQARLQQMGEHGRTLGRTDAAQRILEECERLVPQREDD
ncbi:MAG: undecaprenyldiphospho-muramoylpentapeptide beta-N-acetylglucosaminyltransferase [Desulfuromonas sp.]|nr:MAG: undecaprenyldiphospho-muramoylpentapeptide beta-N-acetylglucosaminyltransferase [Desulfuromonas sp.]